MGASVGWNQTRVNSFTTESTAIYNRHKRQAKSQQSANSKWRMKGIRGNGCLFLFLGGGNVGKKKETKPKDVALNAKQRRFAYEYVIDLNGAQAAIRAGYAKRSAESQASRLLTIDKVKDLIDELNAEKENDLIATQEEVLKHLTRVMRREEAEHTVVILKGGESKWVTGPDGKPKKVTEQWEEEKVVKYPTKVSDTNRAAELLGKRYAMWTDKTDITGDVGVMIVDDVTYDDEE